VSRKQRHTISKTLLYGSAEGQYRGVSLDGEAERHRPITSGRLGMNGLRRAPM
jgi:hypothetical protein